jgi:hypothetical protein
VRVSKAWPRSVTIATPESPGPPGLTNKDPIQVGRRWVIARTQAWGNQYGKLRCCTERRRVVVEFWLALASAAIVCGRLLRRVWTCYRWQGRPPPAMTTCWCCR